MLGFVILSYATSQDVMLSYFALCYVMSCIVMLCCAMLRSIMLCYVNAIPEREMFKTYVFSHITCIPRYSSNNNAEGEHKGRAMRFLFEMWRV